MNYLELNSQVGVVKDGFYQVDKDTEALQDYLKHIAQNTIAFSTRIEKLNYLIENNFYENFYDNYTKEQISKIIEVIEYSNFKFQSYMSAFKFYNDYALKSNDKKTYLEDYEDRILAVSLYIARGDFSYAQELASLLITQCYQPATPTFLNAGKKFRGELVSCFLLDVEDSLNSISFNISTSMQLSKVGGGVALNLSRLRGRGESIKGVANSTKGVLPVMKLLEDSFNYIDQMGQRKGAGAVYLNIFHSDIEEFLDTKKINADEKSRIQTLSTGVIVPDKFFELAKDNKDFYVFSPYSVFKEYGKNLEDLNISEMYDSLVANEAVVKRKLDARKLLTDIAKTQFESGYPYLIFIDSANRSNSVEGKIRMSNLCTEIFQVQEASEIKDLDEGNNIYNNDVSCILGSLNIVNVMDSKKIEESTEGAIKALSNVSILSHVKNAPTISKANKEFRSIGLGAMNLHGYLIKNNISYESEEAKDFCNTFFMMVNYYSLNMSNKLAVEHNSSFKGFGKSKYKTGEYFNQYITTDYSPSTSKIKELFVNIKIPTKADWGSLKDRVMKNGLYNAYRLAIAPTQSISYLQNSTPSVMPIIEHVESRVYGNSISYYPMPFLNKDNMLLYKTAFIMDMHKLIDLVSVIQTHVDQGISTTLYVNSNATTRELIKLYLYAFHKGLKSLYYTRTKNLSVEECLACSV